MARSGPSDAEFVEPWADRKARLAAERAAAPPAPAAARHGPLPHIVPGSSEARKFAEMWRDGTQIKIIAAHFQFSISGVHHCRKRLKLKPRRQLGEELQFVRFRVSKQTRSLLARRAMERGMDLSAFVRSLCEKAIESMPPASK
jgi:hypothetical protein